MSDNPLSRIPNPESRIPADAKRPRRIALIAGEASGDLLGAELARGLLSHHPSVELVGVCGEAMRRAGVSEWYDCERLSVMGLVEVLKHLPGLLRFRRELRQRLLAWAPDLVVGIDAPDFNLGLERWLKQRGIRTAHYVSPSVWAWREQRAAKIGQSADRVLCLFPMEPPIYQRYQVDARFVGHPTAQAIPLNPDVARERAALSIAQKAKVLAVLPGSRNSELRRLAPSFLSAAALFLRHHSDWQVALPLARPALASLIDRALTDLERGAAPDPTVLSERLSLSDIAQLRRQLIITEGRSLSVMQASDLLLVASGTAALEGMLAKVPMVVGYRIAPLTHWIVKRLGLLKVDRYSLPNVLAGEDLVPECMQHDCTASRLCAELMAWLQASERRQHYRERSRELHQSLLPPSESAAAVALSDLLATGEAS
ncbi:lipid-A-disaccharide synthase [Pseudoxanthomonas sp. CAU 1598]|uniref:Lipid-A-disaccharide synthase n=1 Tax=Pseudomarimonas arenosa TaxID=2774145 RepID=A0AAW3ZQ41_9GAMM|nr:lipid-A-disaccharide synthase [Pseudomarimonas arenosa]